MDDSFVVLDIETTGLSRFRHGITEISAVRMIKEENQFKIHDEFSTLLNPGQPIPRFITRLTGISDDMVKDAPSFKDIGVDLRNFIGDSTIVAHNATFDYNFLNHYFEQHKINMLHKNVCCTRKLSRRLLDLPSYKLSKLCDHFSITNMQAHRAMADVLATKELFENLYNIMKDQQIISHEDILKFQSNKISKK